MMAITPIFIMLIVIGCVVGVAFKLAKTVNRSGWLPYSMRVRWAVGAYLAILIISMVISNVLPVKGLTELEKVNSNVLDQESTSLYDAAIAGNINQYDQKFLLKSWDFKFKQQQLEITTNNDTSYNITFIVERKGQNDGHIEIGFYMTRSEVNGVDISKLVHPPGLEITGNRLRLTNSSKNQLRLSQFSNVFTVKQFNGENFFGHESYSSEGQAILYLKVPQNLKIIKNSDLNLEYVK